MSPDPVLAALERAVQASPADVDLRLHLAALLLDANRAEEARDHLTEARHAQPDHPDLAALTARLAEQTAFDWSAAAAQLGPQPAFVDEAPADPPAEVSEEDPRLPVEEAPAGPPDLDAEAPTITLADVGGLEEVKKHLMASFLAPMKNPALTRLYRKSLKGGLLLYGPPGCGKTYLARAVAGELGASFLTATTADLLDVYMGASEKLIHEYFRKARAAAPCVLFLDEIDGLGGRRSTMRHSPGLRNALNQLLAELDGVGAENEGVYVLAATNQPWDVDPALRRPGRLDRTLLVLPPDAPAREAIFAVHLRDRPLEGIHLPSLAQRSDGLSGADIQYVCEVAAQDALLDSLTTGQARPIRMQDLYQALDVTTPSTRAWFDTARTAVTYGSDDGTFRQLKAYLKKNRLW
ncbi:ATP-binding protein [Actinotalea sp. BY-33]|uniref:ATP-binding protein n=1 Tax=Actinotalea soli TaxID=2819234 RepID=A0A939RSI2_9CELL|nr:ATP-binding protein [Actinotalea soli]MBO1751402.1 ATP-binding protein [Actinotalea soli]